EIFTLEHADENQGPALDNVRVEPVPAPNLLVNGSFEDGREIEAWKPLETESIPGWKITRGAASFGYWMAADGKRSVFFPGVSPAGSLGQTFSTIKGRRYRVSFSLSANPNNGWWGTESSTVRLAVAAAGKRQEFSFHPAGKTPSDMGWATTSWEFEA